MEEEDDRISTPIERRKQLSKKEKRKIISRYYDKRQSIRNIAKHYGRHEKTIARVIKKHEDENGNINRKIKLTKADKNTIIDLVYNDPYISLNHIQENLHSSISICTINRYLRKNGYNSGKIR